MYDVCEMYDVYEMYDVWWMMDDGWWMMWYDRGQVRVIFLRTELFPYLFPSDAPAGALMRPTLATGLMIDSIDFRHDSTKVKQVWLCSRCSVSSRCFVLSIFWKSLLQVTPAIFIISCHTWSSDGLLYIFFSISRHWTSSSSGSLTHWLSSSSFAPRESLSKLNFPLGLASVRPTPYRVSYSVRYWHRASQWKVNSE